MGRMILREEVQFILNSRLRQHNSTIPHSGQSLWKQLIISEEGGGGGGEEEEEEEEDQEQEAWEE